MSQTRQRNGILRRCAKGHCDVQHAAAAEEKSLTIFYLVIGIVYDVNSFTIAHNLFEILHIYGW